jgi:hypothetical protein
MAAREREREYICPLITGYLETSSRDTSETPVRMRHGAIKEKHPVLAAAFWKSVHEQPLLLSKAIQTIP